MIGANGKTASATLVPQILTSIFICICQFMLFMSKCICDKFIHNFNDLFDLISPHRPNKFRNQPANQ